MKSIENRNESFKGIVDRLPQKRKEVYELIKSNPNITIQEASEKLGKPINEVSGRFTELKEAFLIRESENKINGRSGFKNTSYVITDLQNNKEVLFALFNHFRAAQIMLEYDIENCEYKYCVELLEKEKTKIDKKLKNLSRLWMGN